jgi:phage N-6-adenine-methyltransferase
LEQEFGLPIGWTDPQEHRAATQLLELEGQPSETVSTTGLVKSSGGEYFTSTHSEKKSKKKSSDCWYTPSHIVKLVVKVLGQIDLDPCADDGKHISAKLHYTATDDGLIEDWEGRVFINPPYSCPGLWMKKLQAEFESGRVNEAITLVPAATDTNWLSPLLKTQAVCFWKGRIKFLDKDYQPRRAARQSHVLVYWGENWQRFKYVFEPHGFVSVPSQFLEDKLIHEISSRKSKQSKFLEDKLSENISSRKVDEDEEFLEDKFGYDISSRKADEDEKILEDKLDDNISSRKTRRCKGDGSGCIYYRTVTKKGKEYREAYYQYEVWKDGDHLVKSSKYISKRLLSQVQQLEVEKVSVKEILKVLGVVV